MAHKTRIPARARNRWILVMWTGPLEGHNGLPREFKTRREAIAALEEYPSWGRDAVQACRCRIRPNGRNGNPDYVISKADHDTARGEIAKPGEVTRIRFDRKAS